MKLELLAGLAVCVGTLLGVAWVMAISALVLWSVNTLSSLAIPYSVQSIAAVAILLAVMRRIAK